MKALIVDGYVDEPALLGVPPYVSTYPRYIAGVFLHTGFEVEYLTIDQIRKAPQWPDLSKFDYMVVIAGLSVSGHYLGGTPLTFTELQRLITSSSSPQKFVVGPIGLGYTLKGGTTALSAQLEAEVLPSRNLRYLWNRITGRPFEGSEYQLIDLVAPIGAEIVKKHPRFPNIICELELSRGCERRDGFCSFCTEPIISKPSASAERQTSSLITKEKENPILKPSKNFFERSPGFNRKYYTVTTQIPHTCANIGKLWRECSKLSCVTTHQETCYPSVWKVSMKEFDT